MPSDRRIDCDSAVRPGVCPVRRRLVVSGIAGVLTGFPAFAAPRADARVGYLEQVRAADGTSLYREFVEGLQAHGYVEGRNLRLLRRSAELHTERLRAFAAEMAAAKVDVILATTTEGAKSAKVAAPGTPTVFVVSTDPVHEGLVASISHPRGALTGVVTRSEDLTAKRLQLLKEAFPRIRTVAIVGSNVSMAKSGYADAASRLDLGVLEFPVHRYADYGEAAAAISRSKGDAVLVVEDADAVANIGAFARLLMATRRPVMFNADVFVEGEGWGLMAYGVSLRERYRRAARMTGLVLDGAKPADIPVEMPARYELVVNLRVAEDYAIVVPPAFLLRADRVLK
jgi:putative ABC transport system substrate-binding protein